MSKATFRPLIEPQLSRSAPTPAPVSWFERLATPLPTAAEALRALEEAERAKSGNLRATFLPVESYASAAAAAPKEGAPVSLLQAEWAKIARMTESAEQEALALLHKASQEAERIRNQAQEEAYALGFAQGLEAGKRKGYQEGEAQAQREAQAALEKHKTALHEDLQALVLHIEAERERIWAAMEPRVLQMVLELTRHVVKHEAEACHETALFVVKNAIRRVSEGSTLRIRVNSADLEMLRSKREELLEILDGIRHLEILEDRRVGQGGCLVETEAGSIDARLETQLQTLEETLSPSQGRLPYSQEAA